MKLPKVLPRTLADLPLLACAIGLALTAACGAEDATAPTSSLGPTAPSSSEARTDAGPPRSPGCVAQDEAIAALVASTRKSPVAALAVTNEACGTSVYVASEGAPPPPEALFRVGSVTKTHVAATVLALVGEGKIALDDPVTKHLPEFPMLAGVTVRHLLSHTSGIFNFTQDPEFFRLKKQKRTPKEIVERALREPLASEPGKAFAYSNTNYTLLGMIVERASGTSLGKAIRARVLEPLGLRRTFLDGEEPLPEPLVPGFDMRGKDQTNAEDPSNPWAAGAMVASVGDVARLHQALYTGTHLPRDAREALTLSPVPVGDGHHGYGLGVFVLDGYATGGHGAGLGHGGDIEGYHTDSMTLTERRTTFTSIVNQDGVSPRAALLAAANALFPK